MSLERLEGLVSAEEGRPELLTYGGAVNAALRAALERLPETILFGEDVAAPGGVFGITKGLQSQFGERVFDTPISESAILGAALGAALVGRRPVVEIMWADFLLVALDQLINQAANTRYVSRGELAAPITIRTQQGAAPGSCAQHSQSLEVLLAHIPGLQVCMPASHQDAHDLTLAAVMSNDPTIVIENRTLYHGAKEPVRTAWAEHKVGGSRLINEGDDLTIVSWGATVFIAQEAASALMRSHGIGCDVIDLRWLRPLDLDPILASAARTKRLVVVHEAHTFAGLGAEIVAAIAEAGIELASAPRRIGTPDCRMPAAPVLANSVLPSVDRVVSESEDLVSRR